ncbi:DUF1003 domain-containing protein [Nocardia seriolae]|uniref:Membrane protein n=1 Tax=Nocardia seriolae TaxID=37332 RepID=A0A0B8NCA1_9NOCA|nr:DUF1003 domain-containing protein [Nocardia seriolae]APA96010.1 hypothetical protein NS506_01943 [Nocardia seriolae]MTJ65898.1 DUF1003 domain-containing protein [Nocardia seriolae]MTJ75040.1 DUF1003 domain-containing protein [Nocardia seriolae]MTJ86175.1 DUF1003 domain-containing protein [Nocardia seriolae]MTK30171.1 DUF1003 domain-containing protein [Nocardia seriolae]
MSERLEKTSARQRLETPVESRFRGLDWDAEAMARTSENIARFLGTGRYLVIQTVIVIVWILLNVFALRLQWDPYPFILLNLAFSTQAAYAAPLILLAQNRQDNRDRVSLEEDRSRAAQTKADTEFLARELASLRLAVGEVATRDYVRRELDDIKESLLRLEKLAVDGEVVKAKKAKKSTDRKTPGVANLAQNDGD